MPVDVMGAIEGVTVPCVDILRMIITNRCCVEGQGKGDLSRLVFSVEIKLW